MTKYDGGGGLAEYDVILYFPISIVISRKNKGAPQARKKFSRNYPITEPPKVLKSHFKKLILDIPELQNMT